jgi:hypothetical protein
VVMLTSIAVFLGSCTQIGLCPKLACLGGRDLLADGLAGWQQIGGKPGSWKFEDGILYTAGGGGGWLSTKQQYDDFRFELEFRVPAGGNSGVFMRAPHEGDPAYQGMEIQILDDYTDKYGQLRPSQYTGSIYDVQAPSTRVSKKANEWQKMIIVCDGPKVQVTLNGTRIIDTDLNNYPEKVETHPGLKRTKGYIGLQDHGSRIDFRNIKIRKL